MTPAEAPSAPATASQGSAASPAGVTSAGASRRAGSAPEGRRERPGKAGTAATAWSDPGELPPPTAQQVVAELQDEGSAELFGITELCTAFGISPRAIRFYEDKGLLAPRRINGTRVYTRRDRARLALILRAKAIGSSLAEIKRYLDMYGSHGEGREQQLRYVLARTDEAIAELELKRAHIEATLAEIRVINAAVREKLAAQA